MKILIVDDEFQIRSGLQQGIDWGQIGISEVLVADNGISALQLFKQYHPEIIITDIRMPRMDGLALIKAVRALSGECKYIILSGYSEFEYVKKAIQYGVVDYELKPVNIKHLLHLVEQTIETIVREQNQTTMFQEYWSNRLVRDLANNSFVEKSEILELLTLGIKWKLGVPLRICMIQANVNQEGMARSEQEHIQHILEEEAKRIPGILHMVSTLNYVLIMNSENRAFELDKWWQQVNERLNKFPELSMALGVSDEEDITHLSKLYEQAQRAIQLKLYSGSRSIYYYYEVVDEKQHRRASYVLPEEQLWKGFQENSFHTVQHCIDREFDVLLQERNYLPGEIREICARYIQTAEQFVKRISSAFNTGIVPDAQWSYHVDLDKLELIDEFRRLLLQVYEKAYRQLQDIYYTPNNKAVSEAIKYIYNNYNEDLSAKKVAERIQLSPNYFSHIFKQVTGFSYTEFLNHVRIEEATKQLQLQTNPALYEISEKVGFKDYKYFTQIFKKHKGVSPSEYQRSRLR